MIYDPSVMLPSFIPDKSNFVTKLHCTRPNKVKCSSEVNLWEGKAGLTDNRRGHTPARPHRPLIRVNFRFVWPVRDHVTAGDCSTNISPPPPHSEYVFSQDEHSPYFFRIGYSSVKNPSILSVLHDKQGVHTDRTDRSFSVLHDGSTFDKPENTDNSSSKSWCSIVISIKPGRVLV